MLRYINGGLYHNHAKSSPSPNVVDLAKVCVWYLKSGNFRVKSCMVRLRN